jgi:hypothetical protein
VASQSQDEPYGAAHSASGWRWPQPHHNSFYINGVAGSSRRTMALLKGRPGSVGGTEGNSSTAADGTLQGLSARRRAGCSGAPQARGDGWMCGIVSGCARMAARSAPLHAPSAAHASPHSRKLPAICLARWARPCCDANVSPLPRRQKTVSHPSCCNLTRAGHLLAHKHAAGPSRAQAKRAAGRCTWPLESLSGQTVLQTSERGLLKHAHRQTATWA